MRVLLDAVQRRAGHRGNPEAAWCGTDRAGTDKATKRAGYGAQIAAQGQDHKGPGQRRSAQVARGGQLEAHRGGTLKELDQRVGQFFAVRRIYERAQRHAAHFHAHQFRQMRAGDPKPGKSRRDAFGHESLAQKILDAAGIDMRAQRDVAIPAHAVPVAKEGGKRTLLRVRGLCLPSWFRRGLQRRWRVGHAPVVCHGSAPALVGLRVPGLGRYCCRRSGNKGRLPQFRPNLFKIPDKWLTPDRCGRLPLAGQVATTAGRMQGRHAVLRSMTAFASGKGAQGRHSWSWDLRSVNGKGLDLRLRVPDWIEGLEAALRARLGARLSRGNVTVGLKIQADEGDVGAQLNDVALEAALTAMAEVEAQAMDRGLSLAPATAADILGVRGVLEAGAGEQDTTALREALLEDFDALLAAFVDMRETEGKALQEVLNDQIDQIAQLTEAAAKAAEARRPEMQSATRAALARVMDNTDGVDEPRVAQELALIAMKADVTEEIDRLRAHVQAARDLIAQGSPIGRKLDFLSQEFNREANTLCSKAQNAGLTSVGLDLKAVIDQMREQVQNVE